MLGIIWLVFACLGIVVYFVPSFIAFSRKKSNKIAIFMLNFFLGWSLIGWVVSLVWSLTQDQQQVIIQQTFQPGGTGPASSTPFIDRQGEM